MTLPDFAILFAFIAYGIWAGIASRRRAWLGLDEYFLAGMTATRFAADTPPLVMGLIVVGSVASLWRLRIYGLAFLFMGFVLGFNGRRAGVLTDAELRVPPCRVRGTRGAR